jgi:hypothetical protein
MDTLSDQECQTTVCSVGQTLKHLPKMASNLKSLKHSEHLKWWGLGRLWMESSKVINRISSCITSHLKSPETRSPLLSKCHVSCSFYFFLTFADHIREYTRVLQFVMPMRTSKEQSNDQSRRATSTHKNKEIPHQLNMIKHYSILFYMCLKWCTGQGMVGYSNARRRRPSRKQREKGIDDRRVIRSRRGLQLET